MQQPATVVVHADCETCLRRHMQEKGLEADVTLSQVMGHGDLGIDGNVFLGALCDKQICPRHADDEFEALLERIRKQEHPDYGMLSWDGQQRQVGVTVTFERNGVEESDAAIRERALRYLEGLTPGERAALDVDVTFRDGRPVKAVLRGGTGELSVERLRQLATRLTP